MLKNLLELVNRPDFWPLFWAVTAGLICLLFVFVQRIRRYFNLNPEYRLWLLLLAVLATQNTNSDPIVHQSIRYVGWVVLTYWLYWASWFFVVFRWLWYFPALLIGRFRAWFRHKGFLLKVGTVWGSLSLFIGWIVFTARHSLQLDSDTETSFFKFILKDMFGAEFAFSAKCALAIILLYSLYQLGRYWFNQSNQIVIQPVKTYGVPKNGDNTWVEGLPARLNHELQRINGIFEVSDYLERKINDTGTSGADQFRTQTPQFNLGSNDIRLDTILAKETEVKVGWLSFSPKAIVTELNRLVPRSSLSLSIYFFEHQVILDAALSGKSLSQQWRVERSREPKATVEQLSVLVYTMIEELSYQIFGDVQGKERLGSPNWKAIRHYLEGVTAYRKAINSSSDSTAMLNTAEVAFGKALVEDNDFGRCFYNLGIVYSQLGNDLASVGVFQQALQLEPDNQDAWYALAMAYRNQNEREKATEACEQVIRLNADKAAAWNLIGMLAHQKTNNNRKAELHFAVAAMLSWKNLCLQLLKGNPTSTVKKDAALYLRNLGVEQVNFSEGALLYKFIGLTGISNLMSSLQIDPADTDNRYQLMMVLVGANQLYHAKRQAKKLVQTKGVNHLYHLWYATLSGITNNITDETHHLRLAFANGMNVINTEDNNYHYTYLKNLAQRKQAPNSKVLALIHGEKEHIALNDTHKSMLENWENYLSLHEQYKAKQGTDWEQVEHEEFKQHIEVMSQLIAIAESYFPDLLYQMGFKGELAAINLRYTNRHPATDTQSVDEERQRLLQTIQYAQESFSNQPVYFWERYVLHLIYLYYNDWDHAYDELQVSLGLANVNERNSVAVWLTEAVSNKAFFSNDSTTRKENIAKTIDLLHEVIGQYNGRWKHSQPQQADWQLHASLHCWLGQLLIEQLDYHKGVTYLEQGLKLYLNVENNYSKVIEINAWLCFSLVKIYAFEAADDAFTRLEQRMKMQKPTFFDRINGINAALALVHGYAMRGFPIEKCSSRLKAVEKEVKQLSSHKPEEIKQLLEVQTNIAIAYAQVYWAAAQYTEDAAQRKAQLMDGFQRLADHAGNEVYSSLQAELYYYWGEICLSLHGEESDDNLKQIYQKRAKNAWELALKLDLRGEYKERIGERLGVVS
jgi:tetratricopeptide (TPR) repeat protein